MKLITSMLIALAFVGCDSSHRHEANISTELLDTIKTAPGGIVTTPLLFETAFLKGTTQTVKKSILHLNGINIGKIKIPSGRIIACDPLHIDEYGKPFTQLFPTGEFPVQLSIAKVDYAESIAFVRINFSDAPVAKWAFALQAGQQPIPVGGKEIHGYSVDAGIGIFMDVETSKVVNKDKLAQMDDAMYKEMDKHYHYDWKYAIHHFGTHNMAAFTTGLGDGQYATGK